MFYCISCDQEFPTIQGQKFCDQCGGSIEESVGDTITPISSSDFSIEERTPFSSSEAITNQSTTGQQNVDIGDKVTNVYNSNSSQDYCAYGGERVNQDKAFRCPECGRDPICTDHFDQGLRLCPFCTESRTSECSVCAVRRLSEKMAKCSKCFKNVCEDHAGERNGMCPECIEKWTDVVSAMESGDVAISMGTVIGTDQIEIKGDSIVTKDGHPVATIKENTWYTSPKQWHRVKAQLLNQERQAMGRFYPNMSLMFTNDGNAHWTGEIVTWSGKSYSVKLSYPAVFPYRPPNAYVMSPKIIRSRHIYPDGHLCLFHKDDKAWQINTTGATVMSWVSLWLHCYEAWRDTGIWPRPEADELEISPAY